MIYIHRVGFVQAVCTKCGVLKEFNCIVCDVCKGLVPVIHSDEENDVKSDIDRIVKRVAQRRN